MKVFNGKTKTEFHEFQTNCDNVYVNMIKDLATWVFFLPCLFDPVSAEEN